MRQLRKEEIKNAFFNKLLKFCELKKLFENLIQTIYEFGTRVLVLVVLTFQLAYFLLFNVDIYLRDMLLWRYFGK